MVCNGTNALGCAYSKQSKQISLHVFFSTEFIILQHYTLCYYSLSVTLPSLLLVTKTRWISHQGSLIFGAFILVFAGNLHMMSALSLSLSLTYTHTHTHTNESCSQLLRAWPRSRTEGSWQHCVWSVCVCLSVLPPQNMDLELLRKSSSLLVDRQHQTYQPMAWQALVCWVQRDESSLSEYSAWQGIMTQPFPRNCTTPIWWAWQPVR